LDLSRCDLQKCDADILSLALNPLRENFQYNCKFKILNLSHNFFGKEGVKVIAEFMANNNQIEALDLS